MNLIKQFLLKRSWSGKDSKLLLLSVYALVKNQPNLIRIKKDSEQLSENRGSWLQLCHEDLFRVKDKLRSAKPSKKTLREPHLEAQLSQQETIGEIAQLAFDCQEMYPFLEQVSSLVAHNLNISYCAILENNLSQQVLQLVAGVGWHLRDRRNVTIPLSHDCQLTQTIKTGQTLIIEDFSNNHQELSHSHWLQSHQVVSAMSVIIPTTNEPYGVLSIYSREKRKYSQQEQTFLEIIAQLIGKTLSKLDTSRTARLLALNHETRDLTEAQCNRFFSLNLELFCIAGFDGYFKRFNRAFENILGYSAAELTAKPFIEFIHPEDRHTTLAEFKNLSQGQKVDYFENRYRCQDGSYRWLAWTSVAYVEEQIIYAVARDVSEWKKIEIALRKSEEKFRLLFEKSPTAMALADLEGHLIYVNPALCDLVGYREDELLGQRCYDITHPDDKENEYQLIQQLLSGKIQSVRIEKRYLTQNSQIIDALLQLTLIRDVEGHPLHLLGQIINITEQKEKTLALQESEERLGRIISTISDGLLVVDQQGKVCFVNEAAVKLFGRSALRLTDHPLGLPLGNHQPTEIFIQQPQGQLIIAQMRVADINWQGKLCYLVSLRDITENYQAQEALAKSEEKYRQIVETATEGIWIIDQDNKTSFVNQQMATMLGYEVEEMTGKSLFDFVDSEDKIIVKKNIQKHRQDISETHDFKFRCRDGRELWTIFSTNPLFDDEDNYLGAFGMVTNISQRKKIEQALSESEERLEGILTSIQDVIWSLDPKFSQLQYINAAAQIVLGFSLEELYETPNLLLTIVHPDDQELVKHHRHILMEIGHTEFQYRIIRKDGKVRWLHSRIRGVYNEQGKIIRVDGIDSDITEQKRAQQQLQYNATHDPLTNLPNRILFMDRLEHAIERQKRHPEFNFAVLFLDLDEFKVINDSLGHAIGDQLLQEISRRLQKGLRSDDTLARLGGDEFSILLEDIEDIKDAIKIAKRIHLDLTRPFILEGQDIFINTSIGIALSGSDYKESAEILRDADTAMYRAKADGKACYAIFDQKMHEKAVRRLQLETDLRIAIKKQEFKLYYQPIISLETGKITAFEALIRWFHPHKKLISPGHFIPIAEETGLIINMGEWILKEACQQLKQWHQQFPNYSHLKVGVNLSSKQLKYSNLINTIDKVLQETQLKAKSLKLEITETLLMENVEAATDIILKIKERNIEICLDDFGTGYSSLSYLHRFPVNTLKIDRSFVMRMEANNENAEIVRAIVSLAHILGMEIIAEGVETKLQLEQLRGLNCEQGQGYFFAKPLPKEEVEALLKKSPTWN
ncbi:MAG: PAS domain S-box protein [Crocosphaera sp.]